MATVSQVFVTFSGETSKVPDPILTVNAISVGSQTGTLLGSVTGDLQEPRGMAVDAQNRLYVAQSDKKATAILVFPPIDGTYPMNGTEFVVQATQPPAPPPPLQSAPLLHPYGLAFDGSGNLFQSSQDTNVVSGYALSASGGTVTAVALPTASALSSIPNGSFYPGQYVMTFVPLATNPGITLVPQTAGGLDYIDTGSAHSVRGIAIVGGTLYVVDEAAALVGTYDASSGAFKGWITTAGTTLSPAMSAPVGIAADAAGNLYIGDSGSSAIYKWVPPDASTPGSLSIFASGDALQKISGLAVLADGSLIFGSREPVKSNDPSAKHGGKSAETYSIYRTTGGSTAATWLGGFSDTPESLLCVEVPAS